MVDLHIPLAEVDIRPVGEVHRSQAVGYGRREEAAAVAHNRIDADLADRIPAVQGDLAGRSLAGRDFVVAAVRNFVVAAVRNLVVAAVRNLPAGRSHAVVAAHSLAAVVVGHMMVGEVAVHSLLVAHSYPADHSPVDHIAAVGVVRNHLADRSRLGQVHRIRCLVGLAVDFPARPWCRKRSQRLRQGFLGAMEGQLSLTFIQT